mmetsp:Transcript_27707/g.93093  ORF Transcript_27707/g.93093 Transcript_27707/m.93093 type:complete len:278 (-) Transcript_27707:28-861(-)
MPQAVARRHHALGRHLGGAQRVLEGPLGGVGRRRWCRAVRLAVVRRVVIERVAAARAGGPAATALYARGPILLEALGLAEMRRDVDRRRPVAAPPPHIYAQRRRVADPRDGRAVFDDDERRQRRPRRDAVAPERVVDGPAGLDECLVQRPGAVELGDLDVQFLRTPVRGLEPAVAVEDGVEEAAFDRIDGVAVLVLAAGLTDAVRHAVRRGRAVVWRARRRRLFAGAVPLRAAALPPSRHRHAPQRRRRALHAQVDARRHARRARARDRGHAEQQAP